MLDLIKTHVIEQIDFGTLGILFCLMGVVAGLTKLGHMDRLAQWVVSKANNFLKLSILIVMSCFVLSMFVTNDVALIIMVPFSIQVLHQIQRDDKIIKIIVLETIGANMGSMATPIGNPQNVYLYQHYQMQPSVFFSAILPFACLACVLLLGILFFDASAKVPIEIGEMQKMDTKEKRSGMKTALYLVLFLLCLGSVFGIVSVYVTGIIVVITILCIDKGVFYRIDYGLLMKFVILFLIVGNLAKIPFIEETLKNLVKGNEVILGVVMSQFVSNVPAAIMLSKFTENGIALLQGVNIGGLGTLIASMASVISYEFYAKTKQPDKRKYVLAFTVYNLLFLLLMLLVWWVTNLQL